MSLRHPNLSRLIGICESGDNTHVTVVSSPHAPSLSHFLRKSRAADFLQSVDISLKIARGVLACHTHSPKILHKNICPDTILIADGDNVTVTDFFLPRIHEMTKTHYMTSPVHTAPEVLRGEPFTEKADVFSFGILLLQIFSRTEEVYEVNPLVAAVRVATESFRPSVSQNLPPEIHTLITACWAEKPENRPNFSEIVDKLEQIFQVPPLT
eukprot:TRINITY_DN1099_c1_g1_i5.p1 TRINITY_DN1099_c1_g1~~TRINITY_DN1099_c1_g1_i5.p1  ORF type:complete len:211 (+),score=58.37 TRINITY_DN1099_c1_g1_i5:1099-1731(+)